MLLHSLLSVLLFAVLPGGAGVPEPDDLLTEVSTADSYSLTIRRSQSDRPRILACIGRLTGQHLPVDEGQTLVAETDGIHLTYLSGRRLLVLATQQPSAVHADRARVLGGQLRECLEDNHLPTQPTNRSEYP